MSNAVRRYTPRPVGPESLVGEVIGRGDPRYGIIWVNPERLGGTPCFYGTRVPVQTLFDYLKAGESIDSFLEGYPPITREHVVAVLNLARDQLVGEAAALIAVSPACSKDTTSLPSPS